MSRRSIKAGDIKDLNSIIMVSYDISVFTGNIDGGSTIKGCVGIIEDSTDDGRSCRVGNIEDLNSIISVSRDIGVIPANAGIQKLLN